MYLHTLTHMPAQSHVYLRVYNTTYSIAFQPCSPEMKVQLQEDKLASDLTQL